MNWCGTDRGQTTIDFTIGMSIFLAVLVVIFAFVPGVIDPFTAGSQEETVAADRVAKELTQGILASPEKPFVLDRECTVSFFNGDDPDSCNYVDAGSVEGRLGLDARQNVNVVLEGNISAADAGSEQLCWDGDGEQLVEEDNGACSSGDPDDVVLQAGDAPPTGHEKSVTAQRVGSLERWDVRVVVTMW